MLRSIWYFILDTPFIVFDIFYERILPKFIRLWNENKKLEKKLKKYKMECRIGDSVEINSHYHGKEGIVVGYDFEDDGYVIRITKVKDPASYWELIGLVRHYERDYVRRKYKFDASDPKQLDGYIRDEFRKHGLLPS